MRRAGIIFIILGTVLALLAGFALFAFFPRQVQTVQEPTIDLVVAFQNIPERSEIGGGQVGKASWPQHVPTPVGAFANPEDVVGKLAQVPISPGQPIVSQMVLDKGQVLESHSNAAYILEPGTLAIAIPVNTNSNVAEAIQAGDRVDVIASFTVTSTESVGNNQAPEIEVTQRLLQDVLVLQVGTWPRPASPAQKQSASPIGAGTTTQVSATTQSNAAPVVVTLQVKSQDALVLKYMELNAAQFSLALRPVNDHALANPTPVTLDYLQQRFGFKSSDLGR